MSDSEEIQQIQENREHAVEEQVNIKMRQVVSAEVGKSTEDVATQVFTKLILYSYYWILPVLDV